MRALVVEDEAALRDSLKTRLAEAGFTVPSGRHRHIDTEGSSRGVFLPSSFPLSPQLPLRHSVGSILSMPMYGRNASGTATDPSAC